MSKIETFNKVVEILDAHNANKNLREALISLLEPKKGGSSVNVEDVFVAKAKDGKAYLLCSVSGKWMEATAENFYEDAAENNKFGGFKRLSRAAESARKHAISAKKATEKAVMTDLLAGVISKEQAQATLDAVTGPDYSSVPGTEVKPS